MKPYVEITDLQKRIDNFQLGPINLTIEPGTITALVGNNGSGKSTLLKLIMNMANADSGMIKLLDQDVSGSDESWKRNVSYQPQTMIGWDAFTGSRLKDFISSLTPNWDEELFRKLIDLFEVPLNKRFSKLSQGSQQKLSLALTIPRNTELLLLDEPTAFLDIPSKKYLMDILVDWMDQGERSIFITSHQVEDIKKLSDELIVVRNGKMLGNFEKVALMESYKRYWLSTTLPDKPIPGEISRAHLQVMSDQPEATEKFLTENNVEWIDRKSLDLEEIITLLLTKDR